MSPSRRSALRSEVSSLKPIYGRVGCGSRNEHLDSAYRRSCPSLGFSNGRPLAELSEKILRFRFQNERRPALRAPPDSSRRCPDVVPGHGQRADPFHSNGNTTESMGIAKPLLRPLPTAPRRATPPPPPTATQAGPGTPHTRILPQYPPITQDPKPYTHIHLTPSI